MSKIYKRKHGNVEEDLLPIADRPKVLRDDGGHGLSDDYKTRAWFPATDPDGCWWDPSGQTFYSPIPKDPPPPKPPAPLPQDLNYAQDHFFLPQGTRDPFGELTRLSYDGYDLLLKSSEDPLENTIIAQNDYRVLQPRLVTDPNRNRTEAAFDALGLVVGTAVMGKENEPDGKAKGDSLAGFESEITDAQLAAIINKPREPRPGINPPQSVATPIVHELLGNATTRIVYDLDRYKDSGEPPFAATIARETHVSDLPPGQQSKLQVSFSYSDGFGREIQKKIQAEPGPLSEGGPVINPRCVGSGWTIFNNKGKPVRQYEPFFDDTHDFKFGHKVGVSPILFYDPLERVVATLHPNHTYEKVVFDPWQQTTYDVNDTVLQQNPSQDPEVGNYFERLPAEDYLPSWYELRTDAAKALLRWPDVDPVTGKPLPGNKRIREAEKAVAEKAAAHANTPTVVHFDALGRPLLTVAHNRVVCPNHAKDGTEEKLQTRVVLDIEGNQRTVIDAKDRLVMRYDYDIAGPQQDEDEEGPDSIHQSSMEAGERWMLNDVAGNPIRAWDSRGFIRRLTYDELRRPTGLYVTENGTERLAEQTVYGEGHGEAANHRTRVYQVHDAAGTVTSVTYDFKGNLLESRRDLLPMVVSKQGVDWQQNPAANDGSYTSKTKYDALNRPHTQTSPDKSIHHYTFNEANLLETIEVNLRGAGTATPFVTNIDYNAKGQREEISYANGATTKYAYDPLTFRLTQLTTTRSAGLNSLAAQIFTDTAVVQDLHYTYDPAGNITRIEDTALKTNFHVGRIDPVSHYTYDALYRLIQAEGREHIGQTAFDFNPPNGNRRDYPFAGHTTHPNDLQSLRCYTERYEYDAVGNFEHFIHCVNGNCSPSGASWQRDYDYEEDSLIEQLGVKSNRLTRTRVGSHTESYTYADAQGDDVHGCMTAINSMKMVWDFEDQLQSVGLGGGGTAYYIYDASGERVRKIIERQNGTLQKERIYLSGVEIYRDYDGSGTNKTLERETLHVMDDQQRIALVETQTVEDGHPVDDPDSLQRYQLGNHLGSASLELSENAALISYEEYHPYGTTAFQAGRSAAELSLKRYRYTGKERDEETGFSYHGARYYAAWLGKWCSPDPEGITDGQNLYIHTRLNPIVAIDPFGMEPQESKALRDEIRHVSKTIISFPEKQRKALEVREACSKYLERIEDKLQALNVSDENFTRKRMQLELSVKNARKRLVDAETAIDVLNAELKEAQDSLAKLTAKANKLGLSHEVTAMHNRIDRAMHKVDLRDFDRRIQESV